MILSRITENYNGLTDLEKKVVEHILNNPEELLYLTANELAQKLYVSKTSVINLAKKLGFDGYSELRYSMKHHLEKKEDSVKDVLSFNDILSNIYNEVDKTLSLQNKDNIHAIVKKIKNSRAIYIIARGASKPIGDLFSTRLAMLNIKSIFIDDLNLIEVISKSITEEEALILISLSGETEKIIDIAKTVRARGIDIIAFTSFSNNSLQKVANYNMFCFADNTKTKYNDLISRIGLHVLVQIIIGYLEIYKEDINNES